jgi:hypothetical protein
MGFKPGQKVICIDDVKCRGIQKDKIYTVYVSDSNFVSLQGFSGTYFTERFVDAEK